MALLAVHQTANTYPSAFVARMGLYNRHSAPFIISIFP